MFNDKIQYNESDGFIKHNILFKKLSDQPHVTNFKPVKGAKFSESFTYSFFREVFLPQGFPDSVQKDYVPYQIWDTLQAFASTVNSTLTTHSIMKGVGVGVSTATPLAAAITWILKDGTGMVGRIMFAWWQGNNLGSQCKKWRIFADVLNDVAMSIEVAVPYVSTLSSYTLCLTTGMKAIVGIAGGATRTAILQHHSIKDNMADLSAKEHSQGTLVNLAGSIIGILILLFIHESFYMYLCVLLVTIHIISNYLAVTSLKINTLNEDRLCLIIEDYMLYQSISNVPVINDRESVFIFSEKPAKKIFGFDIECGVSFEYILQKNLIQSKDLRFLLTLLQSRKYLPVMNIQQKKIHIILSKDISDVEILNAYFHSCIYAMLTSQMKGLCPESLAKKMWSPPSYPMMKILTFSKRNSFQMGERDFHLSTEFLSAVDELVSEEYCIFIKLLNDSEWVVKANLLPTKCWRGAWKEIS